MEEEERTIGNGDKTRRKTEKERIEIRNYDVEIGNYMFCLGERTRRHRLWLRSLFEIMTGNKIIRMERVRLLKFWTISKKVQQNVKSACKKHCSH